MLCFGPLVLPRIRVRSRISTHVYGISDGSDVFFNGWHTLDDDALLIEIGVCLLFV